MESSAQHPESLPALYRAILDLVADLERHGLRPDAVRIRAEAAAIYGHAWDERGRRRLDNLHVRAWRLLQGPEERRSSGIAGRRRLAPAARTSGR